jgi:hypothetical protein
MLGLAPLNADELRITQVTLEPVFTGPQALTSLCPRCLALAHSLGRPSSAFPLFPISHSPAEDLAPLPHQPCTNVGQAMLSFICHIIAFPALIRHCSFSNSRHRHRSLCDYHHHILFFHHHYYSLSCRSQCCHHSAKRLPPLPNPSPPWHCHWQGLIWEWG